MIDNKKLNNIVISKECHKKIKIISIQKDVPIHIVASDILEKAMSKKNNHVAEENI